MWRTGNCYVTCCDEPCKNRIELYIVLHNWTLPLFWRCFCMTCSGRTHNPTSVACWWGPLVISSLYPQAHLKWNILISTTLCIPIVKGKNV